MLSRSKMATSVLTLIVFLPALTSAQSTANSACGSAQQLGAMGISSGATVSGKSVNSRDACVAAVYDQSLAKPGETDPKKNAKNYKCVGKDVKIYLDKAGTKSEVWHASASVPIGTCSTQYCESTGCKPAVPVTQTTNNPPKDLDPALMVDPTSVSKQLSSPFFDAQGMARPIPTDDWRLSSGPGPKIPFGLTTTPQPYTVDSYSPVSVDKASAILFGKDFLSTLAPTQPSQSAVQFNSAPPTLSPDSFQGAPISPYVTAQNIPPAKPAALPEQPLVSESTFDTRWPPTEFQQMSPVYSSRWPQYDLPTASACHYSVPLLNWCLW